MQDQAKHAPEFLRRDPLTGVGNPLAFFEWLLGHTDTQPISPFALISLDVLGLKQLNETKGMAAGDAALRWTGLVLQEEAGAEVYRIAGDQFVGVLSAGDSTAQTAAFERVSARLEEEAKLVNLVSPAATLAMIHYTGLEELSPEDVLGTIYGAFIEISRDPTQPHRIFDATATKTTADLSGVVNDLVHRMVALGSMFDRSQRLAYSDSISGLPNMHAAMEELETELNRDNAVGTLFAVLMIDGDNLRKYNKIGYLAGDKMIERLGKCLKEQLRPRDFIARWRMGDEFLVLVRDASAAQSAPIAERLRKAVVQDSKTWELPVTISIGIAGHPEHGRTSESLLQNAEHALMQAKMSGRNRILIVGDAP